MRDFPLVRNPTSSQTEIIELQRRLVDFYATTKTYTAFQESTGRDRLYDLLIPLLRPKTRSNEVIQFLELGAGRTEFPDYLKRHAINVAFDAQDITPTNIDYLRFRCRRIYICDIADVPSSGQYDVVISTFVFEHVPNPSEFLAHVDRLLRPGGWHVLFCPRYDLPGYLCPSLRHLGIFQQLEVKVWLAFSRLRAFLDRRPRFWVNCDPSVFHSTWYRDADAVHLVSRIDVERWHRLQGFKICRLYPKCRGFDGYVLWRLLTLNIACQKAGSIEDSN
jgi:SAM-dependent methyltransferase